MSGKVYLAIVTSTKDVHSGGMIQVVNTNLNGGHPISCYASSPVGGGGGGFFGVPGRHSRVLITEAVIDDTRSVWVWIASVYLPTHNSPDKVGSPNSLLQENINKIDTDNPPRKESGDNSPYFSFDNPEPNTTYSDNFLPERQLWKSPKGHLIALNDKVTSERQLNGITIKTVDGKGLILDDADSGCIQGETPREFKSPGSSEREKSKGDRAILTDGKGNRLHIESSNNLVQIVSYGDARVRAAKGIDIEVENPASKSDINISHNGAGDIKLETNYGSVKIDSGFQVNITTPLPGVPIIIGGHLLSINETVLINGLPILTYG